MGKWRKCKLGELIQSVSKTYKFTDKKVIFLNTSDVYLGNIINKNEFDPSTLPGQAKKKIQINDLLFSEIRPANGRYALVKENVENYVVSTKLMVLRSQGDILPDYLNIFLTSKDMLEYLQMLAEDRSGTFPQITFNHISHLNILLPPLKAQKAIAEVLSSLDDKIDLLHRQNKTLEELAQTLFRQWFIEEAKDEWKEYEIRDFATHKKVSIKPAQNPNNNFLHFSLPAFDTNKEPNIELGLDIKSNKYQVEPYSILMSKLNPKTPRVWDIYFEPEKNSICSTEFQVVEPNDKGLFPFISTLLKSEKVKGELAMSASGTSGSHQRVKPEDIFNISFLTPSVDKLKEFSNILEPNYLKKRKNQQQIKTLANLRDTLLPKLMSGEAKIQQIKEVTCK